MRIFIYTVVRKNEITNLGFVEKVGQIFHGVCSNASDVVVIVRVLKAKSFDAILNVVGDLDSNLHAETEFIRIELA